MPIQHSLHFAATLYHIIHPIRQGRNSHRPLLILLQQTKDTNRVNRNEARERHGRMKSELGLTRRQEMVARFRLGWESYGSQDLQLQSQNKQTAQVQHENTKEANCDTSFHMLSSGPMSCCSAFPLGASQWHLRNLSASSIFFCKSCWEIEPSDRIKVQAISAVPVFHNISSDFSREHWSIY